MDRATLHKIFEKAYNHQDWIEVLQSVFGARQLYAQPKPILLPNNERATEAFELGSFTTSDDRIIGLYRINVKSDVWLERNKVSLRELLRNVYKYDVDGAIVVFVQDEKWRLSFISEIKVLNDEGEIIKQATEPKRYTYLLGKDEKIRTPSDRLSKLTGKAISLQDMLNAFSVEALNEEFYNIVQSFFYELVGGKIGKGKKVTDYGNGILQLPNTDRNVRQEFAVRLIGRTVFCWFLKMKKSDDEIALLPETLLSSDAVKHYNNYYHTILERLFFQTLNTPMEERLSNLPQGAEMIPFLNGGLFESNIEDYYKSDSQGNNQNNFGISDDWFLRFFGELEKYNFTIDENSVTEIEVSVDPEMLGRIFENLLAEIDPDSGETARKATGSFYTPREIVDYMATESLVQYLNNETGIVQDKLRPIFKMLETAAPEFTEAEKNNILDALDKIKILDPACGSGAFPMGVLQKIVQALQKLDPEAEWWKKRQIDRIKNPTVKKFLKEKLATSGVEYARKIGVIQNSLYGIDIQPVAAEISKLRCFLSLVVDENIDDNRPNRGVEPLPNLEFKFVTADTLLNLPDGNNQRNMFDNFDEMQELEELRNEYIQSYGKTKKSIKDKFLKVQQKIAKDQNGLWGDSESKAYKLGNWDPFGNRKADWFDPKWMFGFEEFDVVIGNPPYVSAIDLKKNLQEKVFKRLKNEYESAKGTVDLFIFFFERGLNLLKEGGQVVYISPNRYLSASYGEGLRSFIYRNAVINEIVDYSHVRVFKAASTYPIVTFLTRKNSKDDYQIRIGKYNETTLKTDYRFVASDKLVLLEGYIWGHLLNDKLPITERVISVSEPLSKCAKINATSTAAEADLYHSLINESEGYKLINTGTIDRYVSLWGKEYLTDKRKKFLTPYLPKNDSIISQNRQELYSAPKIILAKIAISTEAFFDEKGEYSSVNTNCLHSFNNKFLPKYILAWINSKLFQYTFECFFDGLKMQGGYLLYSAPNLSKMYIKYTGLHNQKLICLVVDYILKLNKLGNKQPINEYVENNHIIQLFDEVIDALMMELYFKEDFEKLGIEFIKYVERDFKSIEEKEESKQIEIIHTAYQKLREKDNEIRSNLKLMDIKLADIVMPIKAGK